MKKSLPSSLSLLSLLCASLMITVPVTTMAQTTNTTKKVVKKKMVKKAAKPAAAVIDDGEDEGTPDISTAKAVEYTCATKSAAAPSDKLTIYHNADDPKHVAIRVGKIFHRFTAIETTTGAKRFENKKYGYVWVGIPSKGMLLNSKTNSPILNECASAEQQETAATTSTQSQS